MSGKEYTGSSVSYYKVQIENPTSGGNAYMAECNDIIEALKMNYAEGNAFKAIWRSCAARNLGLSKAGYKDGKYDAEKVVFFGNRMLAQYGEEESQVHEVVVTQADDGWTYHDGKTEPDFGMKDHVVEWFDGQIRVTCDTSRWIGFIWQGQKDGDLVKRYKLVK